MSPSAHGKGGAGAQRVAAGLCGDGAKRLLADAITPDLAAFIEAQTSVFLATASKDGQPYIQHRGGPTGFLQVLDEKTIGFADFAGNRQFVSLGNLAENPKAYLFLSTMRIASGSRSGARRASSKMIASSGKRLMPENYRARPEQVFSSPFRPGTRIARSIFPSASTRRCKSAAGRTRQTDRRIESGGGPPTRRVTFRRAVPATRLR